MKHKTDYAEKSNGENNPDIPFSLSMNDHISAHIDDSKKSSTRSMPQTHQILVQNIEYDTVEDGVDRRRKLTVNEIPNALICKIDIYGGSTDPRHIAHLIHKVIEGNWLVDRFDWEVIAKKPQQAYHVECQCRRVYGVDVWDDPIYLNDPTYVGEPFTCVPISRERKAA